MKAKKPKPKKKLDRAKATVERANRLMGWEYKESHPFQLIREMCSGDSVVISLDKLNQILDRIEFPPEMKYTLDIDAIHKKRAK